MITDSTTLTIAVGAALAPALERVWLSLGVGLFGREADPANLPYIAAASRTGRWNPRVSLLLLLFLAAFAGACGGGQPVEDKRPEITVERIREGLNGERVSVPSEDGTSESSSWRFFTNEPKEIEIVETDMAGDRATVVINLRTRTSPRAEQQGITKKLAGRLRLYYELRTYVAVRKWEIVRIENLTFVYEKE